MRALHRSSLCIVPLCCCLYVELSHQFVLSERLNRPRTQDVRGRQGAPARRAARPIDPSERQGRAGSVERVWREEHKEIPRILRERAISISPWRSLCPPASMHSRWRAGLACPDDIQSGAVFIFSTRSSSHSSESPGGISRTYPPCRCRFSHPASELPGASDRRRPYLCRDTSLR